MKLLPEHSSVAGHARRAIPLLDAASGELCRAQTILEGFRWDEEIAELVERVEAIAESMRDWIRQND